MRCGLTVLIFHCSKLGLGEGVGGGLVQHFLHATGNFFYGKYNSSFIIRATAVIKAEPLSTRLVNTEHRP